MIRFRFTDDERRFVRLHSEMFEKLARAGLREGVGSETLRNVGKIEQMAFMEGIRQGLAMAWLARQMSEEEDSPISTPLELKAFQLHAMVYGSSDTPLRAVEKEWLKRLGLEEDHMAKSWLDDKPMRFAPATLQELEGNTPPIAPMMSVQSASKPAPVKPSPTELPPPEAMHGAEVTPREPWEKNEYDPYDPATDDRHFPRGALDEDFAQINREVDARDEEVQPESPEFLDIARGEIQTMKNGGWDPKTWQDLILGLHRKMGVDAGYLDIQLTTPVGRTVLDQCGLMGLAPGAMATFDLIDPTIAKSLDVSSLSEPDEGKARDWKDEI